MVYSISRDYSGAALMGAVRRDADGALVPVDADTADSRAYRDWLAAGNTPTPLLAPTLAEAKTTKLAALVDRRWRAETGGVTVGEHLIASDRQSASILYDAGAEARSDPAFAIANWKLADGSFVALDNASLIAAALAVRAHVQSCFDREAMLGVAISAAADAAALAAIDIETGWPA